MYHPYHQQVFEQPTALLENQSLSSNSSSTLSQNHLLTDQTSLDTIVDTMTEDSKRKRSLERNRLAALRCRERKKNEQQQMVEQADLLTQQNKSLNIMPMIPVIVSGYNPSLESVVQPSDNSELTFA